MAKAARSSKSRPPKQKPAKEAIRSTLTDQAYSRLKIDILAGRIPEGEFLDIDAMLRRYSVGRTPFREACHRLHLERLLELVPRRGIRVPELSLRQVRELIEARALIEPLIAELAAVRWTEAAEIDALRMAAGKCCDSAVIPENFEALVNANLEFHLMLARMSQNRELEQLSARLLEQTAQLSYLQLRYFRADQIRALHDDIVEAIAKRDLERVREAVTSDIRATASHVGLTGARVPSLGNPAN